MNDYNDYKGKHKMTTLNYNNKILLEGPYLDANLFIEDHSIVEPQRWSMWLFTPEEDEYIIASSLISDHEVSKFTPTRLQTLSARYHRLYITLKGVTGLSNKDTMTVAHNGLITQERVKRRWF